MGKSIAVPFFSGHGIVGLNNILIYVNKICCLNSDIRIFSSHRRTLYRLASVLFYPVLSETRIGFSAVNHCRHVSSSVWQKPLCKTVRSSLLFLHYSSCPTSLSFPAICCCIINSVYYAVHHYSRPLLSVAIAALSISFGKENGKRSLVLAFT